MFSVAAFYHFAPLPDFAGQRDGLRTLGLSLGLRGTILLAPEGLNGTIAGQAKAVQAMLETLRALPGFEGLAAMNSTARDLPFPRFKVRLKKEIVTMGVAGLDPSRQTGRFVEPADWNKLISDPATLVIDTRNHFEVAYGTFANAVDPGTKSFGAFPDFVRHALSDTSRPIAMFCTGGIRCEKATSYLISQGFTNVHQLKGGILNYLETIPESESLWRGRCFVFDEREALGHGLKEG
jgi:UPF0176 protein